MTSETIDRTSVQPDLAQTIADFLSHCARRNLSSHTVKAYRLDLAQFSQFLESSAIPPSDVSTEILLSYLDSISHLKPRSRRRKMASLKSFFRFAFDEGIVEENPTERVRARIKIDDDLPKTLSFEETSALFQWLYTEKQRLPASSQSREGRILVRDIALLETLFSTGVRVGELSTLRTADIDLERGMIRVTGKGRRHRRIPICDGPLQSSLKEYLAAFRRSLQTGPGFLFLNSRGKRLSEQSIRAIVKKRTDSANVTIATPHMFRHTVATQLLERGTDIRFIQTFLGHSSITTTTIYARVTDESQKRILESTHPRQFLTELQPSS